MTDDAELLRRYAESGSEPAFAELVGRHLGVVYFAALRRTDGNAVLAEEIAQQVFTEAARHARKLAAHPSLLGWLYTTTRNVAANAVRAEKTRQRIEQAVAMHELNQAEPAQEWEQLRPIIDEVLDALEARERDLVLIRFFEGRPFADIGAALRISQDAARMRVDRALEKVRHQLERRGIRSAGAALAAALAAQGSLAVPTGLVTTVSSTAVAAGTAAGGAAVWLGFMSATKVTLGAAAVATVLATGFGLKERNRAQEAAARITAIEQERTALQARLTRAEKGLSQAETRATEAEKDSGALLAAVEAARAKQELATRNAAATAAARRLTADDPLSRILNINFPDGIVLTMGEKTITVGDVHREILPLLDKIQRENPNPENLHQRLNQLQSDVISELMQRELLVKEFNHPVQGSRKVATADVEAEVATRMQEQFNNDPAKLSAWLESMGLTPAAFRKEVEEDIIYAFMRSQRRKLDKAAKDAKAKQSGAGP